MATSETGNRGHNTAATTTPLQSTASRTNGSGSLDGDRQRRSRPTKSRSRWPGYVAVLSIAILIAAVFSSWTRRPPSQVAVDGPAAGEFHANGDTNSASVVSAGRSKDDAAVHGSSLKTNNAHRDRPVDGTEVNDAGATLERESEAKNVVSPTNRGSSSGVPEWAKDMKRQSTSPKTILRSDRVHEYILKTYVYPREHEQLKELRLMTEKLELLWKQWLSAADEGPFLQVILKLMNAKNTIEIGTYTGYSLLSTALALPADGKITAMDINKNWLDLGWPYIEKAGMASKIDFMEGPALDSLDTLLTDVSKHNFFDFAFVDADKPNYLHYHERLLRLVRVGGVIAYDNTLWNGSMAATSEELKGTPHFIQEFHPFIYKLNEFLSQDPRIEPALVSIGDGVTLCRRVI